MPKFEVFSCVYHLVGEQPIPVFLSAIQFAPSTNHILLGTERTKRTMENVKKSLETRRIKVECHSLGDKIANNFNGLLKRFGVILPESPDKVCMNITGGTKPMAFVALSIARPRGY